jgi:hypothetical protein
MIEPTIGRVVWLYRRSAIHVNKPEAALVADAWLDKDGKHWYLNLSATDHLGNQFSMTSVPLIQDTADADVNAIRPYATWMPYQKGQAARAEELEKELQQTREASVPHHPV